MESTSEAKESIQLQEKKVSKAVGLVLTLAKSKKTDDVLEDEHLPIQMQIDVKKIPKESKQLKLKLPHPVAKPGGDICLFVKDLDKSERDTEPTVNHYEDLLAKKKVKNVKEIIPFKSLKTDYKPYESKWNLSNAYDVFLADERIMTALPRLLGKNFYGRKKAPTQLNMLAKDLQGEIDRAVNVNKFSFSGKGSTSMAVVGHSGMDQEEVVANVMAAADQVAQACPGTFSNIKQLCIKARSCSSIPIYLSEGGPQAIKLEQKKKKAGAGKVEIDDLSTLTDGKVAVYPDGRVLVIKEGESLKDVEKRDRLSRKRKMEDKPSFKTKKFGSSVKKAKIPQPTVIRKKIK